MDIRRQEELKAIVDANLEVTSKVTRPTELGVRLIADFFECETALDYMGEHAADILLAIDAVDGTRPAINNKAAKAVLS